MVNIWNRFDSYRDCQFVTMKAWRLNSVIIDDSIPHVVETFRRKIGKGTQNL
jgi:hypothetical protein